MRRIALLLATTTGLAATLSCTSNPCTGTPKADTITGDDVYNDSCGDGERRMSVKYKGAFCSRRRT